MINSIQKLQKELFIVEKHVETIKYNVLISYRRDSGEHIAKVLRDRLSKLGYAVLFDVECQRSGDFNTNLDSVIGEAYDIQLYRRGWRGGAGCTAKDLPLHGGIG